jgi:hypothetical protein
MITMSAPTHVIKTVKQGDKDWYIKNQFTIAPRAGFEISTKCPSEYRMILSKCIDNGWVKPIAYMKESEYVWEQLQE